MQSGIVINTDVITIIKWLTNRNESIPWLIPRVDCLPQLQHPRLLAGCSTWQLPDTCAEFSIVFVTSFNVTSTSISQLGDLCGKGNSL